jgi:hypothetical protein
MKYLFYNCQLLLLCCACCKFAIQAFMQEDRYAIQTTLAKRLLVLRTKLYPLIFHRKLQINYGILPQLPTGIPTDLYLLVFHRELQKKITIFCHNYRQTFHNYRRIYWRVHQWMVHIPKSMPVSSYQWICRRTQ